MKKYLVGFDIGSEFVHSVTIDDKNKIVLSLKSIMHFGNPLIAVKKIIDENKKKKIDEKNSLFGFTGSCGVLFSKATNAPYFYDSLTIPLGSNFLDPKSRYIFHLGSKDPYFFEKSRAGEYKVHVPDFSTGTKCGGGSGILINKQCNRLFFQEVSNNKNTQEAFEKMYELAIKSAGKSDKNIDVGGRCGVVIQSDMIHLQNSGESIPNIIRGLFERVARNYKSDVVRIRSLNKNFPAIATGGVSLNKCVVDMLKKHLNVNITVPKNSEKVGAIGVALKLREMKEYPKVNMKNINNVRSMQMENIDYAPPLSKYLHLVKSDKEKEISKYKNLKIFIKDKKKNLSVVMGVDGGSTTTKAVLLDSTRLNPIAEICIETHGRPLEAIQNIFREIKDYFKDRLLIKAVAYTGSSGAFYYKLFTKKGSINDCSDLVIDEITCHALGVKKFNDNVDTIFELGGQDAKFTIFCKDGSVKKAKMNLSCMAGTGQTMQNMIKMIGLSYDEFEKLALKAKRTPIVDDTCGVFTESGISNLVSIGLPKEEIAAAIAYGFIGGYINKFVGTEKFGDFISAQGGPFNNIACLAALALHTGKEINAFPHRQLFGAYGAAIAAYQRLNS
jgi:activator of 2-hydroxyglutaryl-CoA dehydratase